MSKRIDWVLVLVFILVIPASFVIADLIRNNQGDTKPKECLDYTLREYREGDAPAKCQAEVYGDQF